MAQPEGAGKFLLRSVPAVAGLDHSHELYELVRAVLAGDADIVKLCLARMSHDVSRLVEPLDGHGTNLMHVAAISNRPPVMEALLESIDKLEAFKNNTRKLEARREAVDASRSAPLGASGAVRAEKLAAHDRLMHIACEQTFLELLAVPDSHGRTTLHYAASSRGVMVGCILSHAKRRFAAATSGEGLHRTPLFPPGAFVSPSTGELWMPGLGLSSSFAAGGATAASGGGGGGSGSGTGPTEEPPAGFIAMATLLKARTDPAFVDARDINGGTPLVYATVAGDVRAIRVLLEHGADGMALTTDGLSPLDLASNRTVRAALVPIESAVQSACGLEAPRAGVRSPAKGAAAALLATAAGTTGGHGGGFSASGGLLSSGLRSPGGGFGASRRSGGKGGFGGGAYDADMDDEEAAALEAAAKRSRAEASLLLLVNSGEDINGRAGVRMRAPLHMAVEAGALDVVDLLLNSGAIVDIIDVNGETPLHRAAEAGTHVHQEIVRLLAEAGADINATSSLRKTPLMFAAAGSHAGGAGASGSAAIAAAASRAAAAAAAGGGAGRRSGHMSGAPSSAAMLSGHDSAAAMGLGRPAAQGPPITIAADGTAARASGGSASLSAKALGAEEVESGAATPARGSIVGGEGGAVEGAAAHAADADADADADAATGVVPTPVLGRGSSAAGFGGSGPSGAGAAGAAAGAAAAVAGAGMRSDSLHEGLGATMAPGTSPYAMEDGGAGMVALLVSLGANIDAVDAEGNTALMIAAKRGNFTAVDTLLSLGARVYAQNIHGATALHCATFHHHIPVVRQLVRWDAEYGRLKYILDASGRSAYDVAADSDTRAALHTLLEACASGRLDLAQVVASFAAPLPHGVAAPWLPLRATDVTRVLRRSALHCAISGAAKALARWQAEGGAAASGSASPGRRPASGRGGASSAAAAAAAASPLASRHAKPAPSAVHTIAGIGLRFAVAKPWVSGAPAPPSAPIRYGWGGSPADVSLTFYAPPDEETTTLAADVYAYTVPPQRRAAAAADADASAGSGASSGAGARPSAPGAAAVGKAFLRQNSFSSAASHETSLQARRLVPGSELTSSQVEKEFGRVVEFLLRSGTPVDGQDIDGVTPAMLAARYGLLYLLRKLLSRGASPAAQDTAGNTVAHYAFAFGHVTAAAIVDEFSSEETARIRNGAGRTAPEVAAAGLRILPDSSEQLLVIRPPPKRSSTLVVTSAL